MLNRNSPITRPPFPSSYPKTAHQDDPTFNLAFQGIHPSIYRSSSTQAFVVAMRFWLWKLHTTLQLGSGESCIADGRIPGLLKPDLATWLAILEIRKLCDDIWVVKTGKLVGNKRNIALQSGSPSTSALDERSTFLVLSINGEVISRSSDLDDVEAREESEIEGCYVRTDWRKLILARTSDTMANTFSKKTSSHGHINDFIRTKDVHEFPRGVSRAWRDRMENVDKCRMAEAINVADRSAVSSCVLQSFNGTKLSATQMDSHWLGRSGGKLNVDQDQKVELYLPESHQVLSVHLPEQPFHPALAIVQRTSGNFDIVLAETGQTVGNEDAGVTELWQGVLGCDTKGVQKRNDDFWRGWEARSMADE